VARTGEAAVKPWVRAFWEERCLPASVRGPVERLAICGWLLALGTGIGFVILGTSDLVVAWAGGDAGRRVVDVVGWEGKDWWGSGVNAETDFCKFSAFRECTSAHACADGTA